MLLLLLFCSHVTNQPRRVVITCSTKNTDCEINTQHWACIWLQCEYLLAKESSLWETAAFSRGRSETIMICWKQQIEVNRSVEAVSIDAISTIDKLTNPLLSHLRPLCARLQIRLVNLELAPCSTRSCRYSCHPPWKTRSAIFWLKWLTVFFTNWMTWFDHTYTRYEKTDRCALLQVNCDFGELIYCPFCHQILVVIEPLLIDEDYYARVEGREIISNLAKVMWQKKVHTCCFLRTILAFLTSPWSDQG